MILPHLRFPASFVNKTPIFKKLSRNPKEVNNYLFEFVAELAVRMKSMRRYQYERVKWPHRAPYWGLSAKLLFTWRKWVEYEHREKRNDRHWTLGTCERPWRVCLQEHLTNHRGANHFSVVIYDDTDTILSEVHGHHRVLVPFIHSLLTLKIMLKILYLTWGSCCTCKCGCSFLISSVASVPGLPTKWGQSRRAEEEGCCWDSIDCTEKRSKVAKMIHRSTSLGVNNDMWCYQKETRQEAEGRETWVTNEETEQNWTKTTQRNNSV